VARSRHAVHGSVLIAQAELAREFSGVRGIAFGDVG
jgi:hypothetical protein